MENEDFKLKASDSANYGFLLFGVVSIALGYWSAHTFLAFATPFFYVIAGAFGLSALISPLFLQYRETLLTAETLEITQGNLLKKKRTISIKEIQTPNVIYIENGQKKSDFLENLDLESNNTIKIDEFHFMLQGEKISFHAYSFEDWDYQEFIKKFKATYLSKLGKTTQNQPIKTENMDFAQKETTLDGAFVPDKDREDNQISNAIQKTVDYITEDNRLRSELLEAMNEAYLSIYEIFTLRVAREGDELRLQKDDVAFYYSKDEENYKFYLKRKYKTEVEAEEIQVGLKSMRKSFPNSSVPKPSTSKE
jgi:hypothetical protein